jgi:dipeptidyl aminopeptidase/acylaminoacyl peptidase
MKRLFLLTAVSVLVLPNLFAQQQRSLSELTVEQIMQDPATWIGTAPGNPSWSRDGKTIFFTWNPDGDQYSSVYKIGIEGGTPEADDDRYEGYPEDPVYSRDGKTMLFERKGDIYLMDVKSKKETRLTATQGSESDPAFHDNDQVVSFTRDNNLYSIDTRTGLISQLSNIVIEDDEENESAGSNRSASGNREQDGWLRNDQIVTSEILRERRNRPRGRSPQAQRFFDNMEDKMEAIEVPNARNLQLSADGKYVSFSIFRSPENPAKRTIVPNYVSTTGYTSEINARSKVGGERSYGEIGIYNIKADSFYIINTEQLPGITDLPDYIKEYQDRSFEKKPRKVSATGIFWSPTENYAVVHFASIDNKDRWIMRLLPESGDLLTIDRQRDEAWIAGPGIGQEYSNGTLGFMPDGKTIYYQSEKTGYSHLYTHDLSNGATNQITRGKFEVYDPFLSKDSKKWYFTANMEHPGIRHFYSIPVKGGQPTQITSLKGNNEVTLSPDEKNLAIRYSYSNKPWELYVQANKPGATAKQLTNSTRNEFERYDWYEPELITFRAEDGANVHARMYKPENPNGAAVIFVHGAGYLQNAHSWWSSYFREYMFNNLLMAKGYTVLDIDYRASAGYGRDWRTGIYRHMGGKDLSDNIDGAKYLVENHNIDPKRIGMYGGSYGGFITLFAMFKHPDVIAAGAALRSVTDWAHYNHGYTSNILNTPVEDPKAYKQSSPIYFAEGLQGDLLIAHGMVDDNVHFQDVVRLAQRLIELGKDDWEMAVYPLERHGFSTPSSWTDEYKRILKLFENTIGKQ